MVYLDYILLYRYTVLVGNPRNNYLKFVDGRASESSESYPCKASCCVHIAHNYTLLSSDVVIDFDAKLLVLCSSLGVTVSVSAFPASISQLCWSVDWTPGWGLNCWALVCGMFWSLSCGLFSEFNSFLPSFVG